VTTNLAKPIARSALLLAASNIQAKAPATGWIQSVDIGAGARMHRPTRFHAIVNRTARSAQATTLS
jgi:hypothetical protein